MKLKNIFGLITLLIIIFLIIGCTPKQTTDNEIVVKKENKKVRTIDKSKLTPGQVTTPKNLTEFQELLKRSTAITSMQYNLSDSSLSNNYYFMVKGRYVKVILPKTKQKSTGEIYNTVYLDRKTKTALTRCGYEICKNPRDLKLEETKYDLWYRKSPIEEMYLFTNATYLRDEMIGKSYAKVFDGKYQGNTARIWVQEYYGFPLKIEYLDSSNIKQKIEFNQLKVNNVRFFDVEIPFNSTVKGEDGHFWFWKHYLGEWPSDSEREITLTGDMLNLSEINL